MRSRGGSPARPFIALARTIALLLIARTGRAQPLNEIVRLNDGSTYQGELVEKVPGDHVTIRLATGEVKRFAWIDVDSARDEASAQPRPAPTTTSAPPAPPSATAGGGDAASALEGLLSRGAAPGHLVDWPEPDRTPPTMMTSRLSFGFVGGLSELGYGAVQVEYYPWNENTFTLGLHAAFGPAGALGPTVGEMLTIEWPLGDSVQQGIGVGLSQSFRGGPMAASGPDLPDSLLLLDADCSHFAFFLSRTLMLRVTIGWSFPVSSGTATQCTGPGEACGNMPPIGLTATAGLFWNFDTSGGDR